MRTHCTSQATLLNALLLPRWEGDTDQEEVYVCTELIHFAAQQKQTQACKSTLFQQKLIQKLIQQIHFESLVN